jgi:hypothetical protein
VLVKQATCGEGRLEVTLKPPFDVTLREVQKVRAAEKVGDGDTRTPPKPLHSNSPGGPHSSRAAPSDVDFSAEIAKWRRERDSNPRGLGGPCGFQVRRLPCGRALSGAVLCLSEYHPQARRAVEPLSMMPCAGYSVSKM